MCKSIVPHTSMYYLVESPEQPHEVGKENQSNEVLNDLPKVKNKKLYTTSLNPPRALTDSEKSHRLPSLVSLIPKSYPPWDTAPHEGSGSITVGKINRTHMLYVSIYMKYPE